MKIHCTYLLLLTFLPCMLLGQTLDKREQKIIEKNHIKAKAKTDYKYVGGKPVTKGIKTSNSTYSPKGWLIGVDILNDKGLVTDWEKYEYDTRGNRTLYERTNPSGNYKKVSLYDEKDNVTLESGFNGAENFRITYKYNAKGIPDEIIYLTNNKIDEKHVYVNSGNTSQVSIYNAAGNLTSKLKLVYDASINIIEENKLGLNDKLLEQKIYKYTADSRILQEEKKVGGVFSYRLTYEYDAKNNLLSMSEESPAYKKYIKKAYAYDTAGNLIEYKWRRNPDEEFNIKKYTYNASGVCLTEYTLYPKTKFELLSKYEYEYY